MGSGPTADGVVHWSADTAFVASNGDLGVTFGFIHWASVQPSISLAW